MTRTYRLDLAAAFRSPLTSTADLRAIESEAKAAGRSDIAGQAREELERRANESSRRIA